MSGASPDLAGHCSVADIEKEQAELNHDIEVCLIRMPVRSRPDTPSAYYAAQILGGFFHWLEEKQLARCFEATYISHCIFWFRQRSPQSFFGKSFSGPG
jgi:hypothetical protein